MDVHGRLRMFLKDKGWSSYRLSKECGLSESTLANIFRRNAQPSIPTLEAICGGFGITLAQFFADNEMVELSPELKELFDDWATLTASQKQAVMQMIKAFQKSNE